jgi:hypothetical protein
MMRDELCSEKWLGAVMAKALLLRRRRLELKEGLFVEELVWRVPTPVRGSLHEYKYSLALVDHDECILRYDNEAGKGDHRHFSGKETPLVFTDIDDLIAMFARDVEGWMDDNA